MKTRTDRTIKICLVLLLFSTIVLGLNLSFAQPHSTTSTAGRKLFTDSITPLPNPDQPDSARGFREHGLIATALKQEDRDGTMALLFSLSIPKEAEKK